MADTVTVGKNITIKYGAVPGNFNVTTYFPNGIILASVKINGAAGMSIIVRDGSGTGEVIGTFSDSVGDGKKDSSYFPKRCKPYILASECTLAENDVVILELK